MRCVLNTGEPILSLVKKEPLFQSLPLRERKFSQILRLLGKDSRSKLIKD